MHNGSNGNNGSSGNNTRKKKRRLLLRRKRSLDHNLVIDYKLPDVLKRFITERGKIIPRRISGASQTQQRKITESVKRARFLALIPSSIAHRTERGFSGEMQYAAQNVASLGGFRRGPAPGGRPQQTEQRPQEGAEQARTKTEEETSN